jgi:uncharacterized protein with HEPN domain
MRDRELALEILTQIYNSTQTILKRFEPIKTVDDFTGSDAGMEKLDAICMQLIAIGEGLKNLDKVTDNLLLPRYPQVEWKKVKALRDIISHHYFDVNAEAIYKLCRDHVGHLGETIKKIIDEI